MHFAGSDEPPADAGFAIMPGVGARIGAPVGMLTDGDVYEFTAPVEREAASSGGTVQSVAGQRGLPLALHLTSASRWDLQWRSTSAWRQLTSSVP